MSGSINEDPNDRWKKLYQYLIIERLEFLKHGVSQYKESLKVMKVIRDRLDKKPLGDKDFWSEEPDLANIADSTEKFFKEHLYKTSNKSIFYYIDKGGQNALGDEGEKKIKDNLGSLQVAVQEFIKLDAKDKAKQIECASRFLTLEKRMFSLVNRFAAACFPQNYTQGHAIGRFLKIYEMLEEMKLTDRITIDNNPNVDDNLSKWFQQNYHLMHLDFKEEEIDPNTKNYFNEDYNKSILRSFFFWGFDSWQSDYFGKLVSKTGKTYSSNFKNWEDFESQKKYYFNQIDAQQVLTTWKNEIYKNLDIQTNFEDYIETGVLSERLLRVYKIVREHYKYIEKESPVTLKKLFNPLAKTCPKYFPFYFHDEIVKEVPEYNENEGDITDSVRKFFGEYIFPHYRTGRLLEVFFDKTSKNSDYTEQITLIGSIMNAKSNSNKKAEEVKEMLLRKHVILQGPPGVGKTYLCEENLAPLFYDRTIGEKQCSLDRFERIIKQSDESEELEQTKVVMEFVQFHASYDYEDFIRGYRPTVSTGEGENTTDGFGFELRDGPFARMATLAILYPHIRFILVVDEINRADIARVMGEAIYLLDRRVSNGVYGKEHERKDERKEVWEGTKKGAIRLRYSPSASENTEVPWGEEIKKDVLLDRLFLTENFHLIGTMNTADKSIAPFDYAMRRRFSFEDVKPDWSVVEEFGLSEKVKTIWEKLNGPTSNKDSESALEEDYRIGHSYFCTNNPDELQYALQKDLLPLLNQYVEDGILDNSVWEDVKQLITNFKK